MSIPFHKTMKNLAYLFCLLLFVGCTQTETGSGTNTSTEPDSSAESSVAPEPEALQDKIVFFELVNPGLGKVYNLHNQTLIDALHGQYIWPGQEEGLNFYPGDSSLESLAVKHPEFSFPLVHKFFSVNKVKELRFGNATKIRLTWMGRADDGRLQARFKMYRNRDHKWMVYGNPGSFTFPGDGYLEAGGSIPDEKGMVKIVQSILVRLTYK